MTKRLLVSIFLLVLSVAAVSVAACGGDLPKDAVAKVGDTYITQEELDKRVDQFAAQYGLDEASDPELYERFQRDVLDYLVTYEIAVQKADDFGVAVTEEDVQAEMDSILENYFAGDQEAFDADLASMGMTMDQLKQNYRESMLLQKMFDETTKDVTTVPDEEIAAYYEENKEAYLQDETRAVRHILIAPATDESSDASTTDADWEEALATAQAVRDELVDGGDWTELAKEYSDDPGTTDTGGDLGTVYKGQMVPEFEESVFSLAKDEISEPIRTSYGYHVIQVTGINPAQQSTLEEVKEMIISTLLNEKKGEAWKKWIEDTKAEVGVIYREGMEPTTTTVTESSTTTIGEETTTTAAGQSITTAAPTTTTTVQP